MLWGKISIINFVVVYERRMKKKNVDINHLAKLANIKLTKKEVKKYSPQLKEILNYINQLEELDTSSIDATARVIDSSNVTFEDGIKPEETLTDLNGLKVQKRNGKKYFIVERIKWE